jgi:hypothetical protein
MTALLEMQAATRAMVDEIGEDVVFRRFTGSGTPRPKTDVTAKARVMGYKASELVGPIVQGDRRVIAMAEDIATLLPITTNDKVVVRGRELAIKAVDDNTRRIGGTLIALDIQVGG